MEMAGWIISAIDEQYRLKIGEQSVMSMSDSPSGTTPSIIASRPDASGVPRPIAVWNATQLSISLN
jgi:hypothetical protein